MSRLWYDKPSSIWEEALPIGNGRLGAMIFGKVFSEEIQLNEESMWYGAKQQRNNPDAAKKLDEIRKLIFEGKIIEAEKLSKYALSGCPESMHPYQSLGNIYLNFAAKGEVNSYRRELDLNEAVYRQEYTIGDNSFTRTVYASKPADAIILLFESKKTGQLDFDAILRRERFFDGVSSDSNNKICLYGNLGKGGFDFAMMLGGCVSDGSIEVIGEHLIVSKATKAMLVLCADTSYSAKTDNFQTIIKGLNGHVERILSQKQERLYKEHVLDYKSLYDRVKLSISEEDNDDIPTDVRLESVKEKNVYDLGLINTYFDYGRYLLISSSREGNLPANLQGIWNKDMTPPWDSKYTVNINLEMNYWPAESCNLSECHMALLEWIKKPAVNGKKTAREMYNCDGFVCHHNSDIYGDTAPQDMWIPGTYWVMGGAWLCTHIWTHYEYTEDIEFLREYYPIMLESAKFFLDFLVEKDGYLVTCPSVSPENTYILPDKTSGCLTYAATMDNQILRDLFIDCLKASKVLAVNDDVIPRIEKSLDRLVPTRIASDGSIMEWIEEYEEAEPGHRHISHLYGLFPSNQISVDKTPGLAAAAKVTLQKRLAAGGGHTGWSRAWITNFYAMLEDGENVEASLQKLLETSTYPNLFDKHPPFQIDGNFGITAAIANILVYSDEDTVKILPALPPSWTKGRVEGLKVKGNGSVDISWENGKLTKVSLLYARDREVNLRYNGKNVILKLIAGTKKTVGQDSFS